MTANVTSDLSVIAVIWLAVVNNADCNQVFILMMIIIRKCF